VKSAGLLNNNVRHDVPPSTDSNAIEEHQHMLIYYPSYVFIQNKYYRWYRSIVERPSTQTEYTENHHILPASIFPELKSYKWNLSKLSYREHFLAHWLLSKCMVQTKHRMKMLNAISKMNSCPSQQDRKLTSWQYEIIRKASSDMNVLRWTNDEYTERVSKSLSTPTERKNRSDRAKARWDNPDFRNKMKVINKKSQSRPEVREDRANKTKKQWQDPKFVEENTFICDCGRKILGKAQMKRHKMKCGN
jgi:hypothetical protein